VSIEEVQTELDQQARWGVNRTHRAVARLLIVVRVLGGRIVDLERRVNELEERVPPPA
jgi:hypothetical protein